MTFVGLCSLSATSRDRSLAPLVRSLSFPFTDIVLVGADCMPHKGEHLPPRSSSSGSSSTPPKNSSCWYGGGGELRTNVCSLDGGGNDSRARFRSLPLPSFGTGGGGVLDEPTSATFDRDEFAPVLDCEPERDAERNPAHKPPRRAPSGAAGGVVELVRRGGWGPLASNVGALRGCEMATLNMLAFFFCGRLAGSGARTSVRRWTWCSAAMTFGLGCGVVCDARRCWALSVVSVTVVAPDKGREGVRVIGFAPAEDGLAAFAPET